jgi:hypothetical protein
MRALPILLGILVVAQAPAAQATVPLMAGQKARPLNGRFNSVPVLHSNQPEEVEGPGILINTQPGSAVSTETGQMLRNAEYTFNGDFGVHLHHKYFPPYRKQISPNERRSELSLGLILINPGNRPVQIQFQKGAVRNSFEAPYLANHLMGVKPLGRRPWNTGPGDATAVQLLRGNLDRNLEQAVLLSPRSRLVLFQTDLPALGIANALLRGRSDGPFQMAVVAARNPRSDADMLAVLDSGQLAPGRVYLRRIAEINNRQIFSRVGGVALGDSYTAALKHDLGNQGSLHVPLTSTNRHHFGTQDIQVNKLASRMVDSSLDNVGTYGVRFDIDLNLMGNGPYELVMSHPLPPTGMKPFTAFRGSLQVRTDAGLEEMHVGLRSGESLALTTLTLKPGVTNPVRVSLVYPADATPGHLLSVVPASQLARVQAQPVAQPAQQAAPPATPQPAAPAVPVAARPAQPRPAAAAATKSPAVVMQAPLRPVPAAVHGPVLPPPPVTPPGQRPMEALLLERYQQALEAQRLQNRQPTRP